MKAPETKHCSCPDCRGSEMNECSQAAVERGNRADRERLLAEIRELLETRGDLERQLIEMSKPAAPKIPVADWECGVCGWIGLAVPIMEVSQRHYEWNKAKGKVCSGIQSRQKHIAKPPGNKRECSICKGNGFLDVEKYDRVEQEDCKWCGTTGIEPQPPMP